MSDAPRDETSTPAGGSRRVEVVADQTQDGAYEIRLEATQPNAVAGPPSASTRLTAVESAAPGSAPRQGRRGAAIGVAAVGVAAVVGAGVAVARIDGDDGGGTPTLDAPEQVESFRSFVLQPPSARTLPTSVLAIDAGGGPEPDAAPELEPEPERARILPDDEPSRLAPAPAARRVTREALTVPAPSPRAIEDMRAVPVDRQLLEPESEYDEYADDYDEYDDEYGDDQGEYGEGEGEYGDEYDDDYE